MRAGGDGAKAAAPVSAHGLRQVCAPIRPRPRSPHARRAQALRLLYSEGGAGRLYRGLAPALVKTAGTNFLFYYWSAALRCGRRPAPRAAAPSRLGAGRSLCGKGRAGGWVLFWGRRCTGWRRWGARGGRAAGRV